MTAPETLLRTLSSHRARQAQERLILGTAYKDQNLVFAQADGSPVTPRGFGSAVRRLIRRIGTHNATLHNLRHTHGSLLAKNGVPIEVVSKRLGHSDIRITTERYLHIYREQDVAAAEAFERLMAES